MSATSRYAIVRNGIVQNICIWDGDTDSWRPPDGSEAIKLNDAQYVDVGAAYDGQNFVNPVAK
ncbi:hypothetical protein [Burkholderia ambifaria]|uniref:hypothetical protein n=1 Tax=Burkholderia ambifaria TaxID=152480 RepID=UPI001589FF06|nr:hypothetical protein [Burkholderia ambifaria]